MNLPIDDNRVKIQNGSEVSDIGVNSTITALGSGETFTGTFEQNLASDVMVSMKTDNSGTLFFDFSNDGTNVDSTFPVNGFGVSANIHEFHTAIKGARYFRVRFVNDTGTNIACVWDYFLVDN